MAVQSSLPASDKLRSLVHYIIWNVSDPAKLGSTKLHKILWFSDARTYVLEGKPITGETYIREKHGPIAKHFLIVRDQLRDSGAISYNQQLLYNYPQDIYKALQPPKHIDLTNRQRQTVDYFIKKITEDHTASSISEESHDYGWEIAEMGEELPYFAILAERVNQSEGDQLEWARSEAKRLGLVR